MVRAEEDSHGHSFPSRADDTTAEPVTASRNAPAVQCRPHRRLTGSPQVRHSGSAYFSRGCSTCHGTSNRGLNAMTERQNGRPEARILSVDNEAATTDLVDLALRYEGFEVATAGTGREAL